MKLIDKDLLIKEIKERMQKLRPTNTHKMQTGEKIDRDILMWLNALTWVKNFINTLEVKEVDLEKEIQDYIYKFPHSKTYLPDGLVRSWREQKVIEIATHFFELGLKAQKGE